MDTVSQNPTLVTAAAVGLLLAAYFTQSEPTTPSPAVKKPRDGRPVAIALTDDELVKQKFAVEKIPADLDVIVIGSGMSGLAAAAALAKHGKRVLVLEQRDAAGGNTQVFERNGYEFHTGLHYLGGYMDEKTSPNRKLMDYLTNDSVEFQHLGPIVDKVLATRADDGSRDEFIYPADPDEIIQNLKDRFPNDHEAVYSFIQTVVRACMSGGITVGLQLCSTWARPLFRWWHARSFEFHAKTAAEVVSPLTTNQDLAGVLTYNWGDFGDPPGRASFATIASIHQYYLGGSFYPVGGPSAIAKSVTRVIESHGSRVLVQAPVETILVDASGTAYGVRVNGKDILAKTIISTVGAPATYTKLIPKAHSHRVAHLVKELSNPNMQSCCSLMTLFVGFKGDAKELGLHTYNIWKFPTWDHQTNFEVNKVSPDAPFSMQFITFPSVKDPTYATRFPGKQVALVIAPNFYEHVEQFKGSDMMERGDAYESLKAMWTDRLLAFFLEEFPKVTRESIEVLELGTALTNDYYLGTTRGAVYGLGHTPARFASDVTNIRSPIKNFFLSGQDTLVSGVVGAAASGMLTAGTIEADVMTKMNALLAM
ncbi:Aste57867_20865 [Aphanomyces stellatus]|uniref:Aste57867_20865 protein n=1 Tax=Aphanomyces stellatus TaxID=120398 RepID=A0A485LH95_9STRA|nr:hypothetical protein As57867_020797 [Aphanomyces stellatus]VFT97542.1 Aste57867_20865 [Aphanomyces stellatus]